MAEGPRPESVRRTAARQHDNLTVAQFETAGFSRKRQRRMLDQGEIEELAPRVRRSALAGPADWRAKTAAAALAYDGWACGMSAAALYGLVDAPTTPEVVVPRGRNAAKLGKVRSTKVLEPVDCAVVDGIPATSPARTLIDLAGRVTHIELRKMTERALIRKLVAPLTLERRARELKTLRPKGARALLAVLDALHPETHKARNAWEAELAETIRLYLGVEAHINHRVQIAGRWYEADTAVPEFLSPASDRPALRPGAR